MLKKIINVFAWKMDRWATGRRAVRYAVKTVTTRGNK